MKDKSKKSTYSTTFGVDPCSTMPDVLIKGYKILRTVSVGQDFSGQHQRFALRQTQWDEEERGDKRRRKTIRKRERQRG